MSPKHDHQARAAEFLRQWQDAMTRQMTNPDTLAAMLAMMQNFGAPHDANARHTAHASRAGDDAGRDYAQRLDALERRVAELHARLDAAEKPARAKPGRRGKPVEASKRKLARGVKSKRK